MIQGVAPLSSETALTIERSLGISPGLLDRVEADHRGRLARAEGRSRLAPFVAWAREFPVKELRAAGFLPPEGDDLSLVESLLRLFGVADPAAFDRLWSQGAFSFRRAQHLDVDDKATAAWLRVGELKVFIEPLPAYDATWFAALVERLPDFVLEGDAPGFREFAAQARLAGVGVVFVPGFTAARSNGATRWTGTGQPVITLTSRYKYSDVFWFSLAHEAAHVLRHPKRRSTLHLDQAGDDSDSLEQDANTFAADVLLRHGDPRLIATVRTVADAKALAGRLDVDQGIIAGQVGNLHKSPRVWQTFSRLRRPLAL